MNEPRSRTSWIVTLAGVALVAWPVLTDTDLGFTARGRSLYLVLTVSPWVWYLLWIRRPGSVRVGGALLVVLAAMTTIPTFLADDEFDETFLVWPVVAYPIVLVLTAVELARAIRGPGEPRQDRPSEEDVHP